jgi:hypothetical protein
LGNAFAEPRRLAILVERGERAVFDHRHEQLDRVGPDVYGGKAVGGHGD